ncbi:MAG: DUF669 domain-containing protein [Pirellulaceae bacterium]
MADLGIGFDPNSEDLKSGSVLPKGDYRLVCVESKVDQTKGGRKYMQFVWQVFEGNGHNRKVFDDHYVFDGDPEKLRSAKGRLGNLLAAAGIKEVFRDSAQMHGKKITARVDVSESEGYAPKNRISSYKVLVAGPGAMAQFSGEAITTPVGQVPPW